MKILFTLSLLAVSFFCPGQRNGIVGDWKTVDDETGEIKSVVRIYEKDDRFFGQILEIFNPPEDDPDPICDLCPEDDPRYNQRIVGMEIIKDMKYDEGDNEYDSGNILDPESGDIYDCKLWVDNDKLKVRGYILFLYRTQTWLKHRP